MATTTVRNTRPVGAATTGSPAFARIRRCPDALSVTGTIPAELDGVLLRAVGEPAAEGGIRFNRGLARWYRRGAGEPAGAASSGGLGRASVARPVADPATGQWHTIATYPGRGHAEHLWLGPDGSRRHAEPFALGGAPLIRTVALTERYLVVFDLPVVHQRAAELIGGRFPYAWQQDRPARIGLLERGAARPLWFTVRPCFVFNAVNAFEDGDRVVVDAVAHERAFDASAPSAQPPRLYRWMLDPRDGSVVEGPLSDLPQELPVVDPRVTGSRHRYVFGVGVDGPDGELATTALLRYDLISGQTQVRPLPAGRRCEQPVFVPRSGAEGDGFLITVVHDVARARSEVLILDAADLCGAPVATVRVPFRLPPSQHTRWQPAS
jgi:carotenoid cleavage dioxygenase-like enzyme